MMLILISSCLIIFQIQIGLQNAVLLLFANEMLLTSFYASTLAVILGSIIFVPSFSHRLDSVLKKLRYLIFHCVMVVVGSYALRTIVSSLLNSKDDVKSTTIDKEEFF